MRGLLCLGPQRIEGAGLHISARLYFKYYTWIVPLVPIESAFFYVDGGLQAVVNTGSTSRMEIKVMNFFIVLLG